MKPLSVMLSFDTEEFGIPEEQGRTIPLDEQVRVSVEGTNAILDILLRAGVKATFFCTTNLLEHAPELGQRILAEGHELASHGCVHEHPTPEATAESKRWLEKQYKIVIAGYRQPKMFPVDDKALKSEGYLYNASLNPACVPGRYMHLTVSRKAFIKEGLLQIPASVVPVLRFPLFWLAEHHLPMALYEGLVKLTLRHDGYFNTYFHPWEFVAIGDKKEYGVPYIIAHRCGDPMRQRLAHLIESLKKEKVQFITYKQFYETYHCHSVL